MMNYEEMKYMYIFNLQATKLFIVTSAISVNNPENRFSFCACIVATLRY